jgi:hypothetical protein
MTKAAFTQNDVYTPAEANAFHEGHENALIAQFDGTDPMVEEMGFTPAEEAAYREGFETGRAKFDGLVYSTPFASTV